MAAFYQPFLLLVNGLYVALRYYFWPVAWRGWWADGLPLAAIAALQWYAYVGILDKAVNAAIGKKKKSSSDTSLVGGASLDLLAVTLSVQYGALLWTPKLYYLLWLVPVWGAYSLYATFFGGSGTNTKKQQLQQSTDDDTANDTNADSAGKRQKRADKRRQKWS